MVLNFQADMVLSLCCKAVTVFMYVTEAVSPDYAPPSQSVSQVPLSDIVSQRQQRPASTVSSQLYLQSVMQIEI